MYNITVSAEKFHSFCSHLITSCKLDGFNHYINVTRTDIKGQEMLETWSVWMGLTVHHQLLITELCAVFKTGSSQEFKGIKHQEQWSSDSTSEDVYLLCIHQLFSESKKTPQMYPKVTEWCNTVSVWCLWRVTGPGPGDRRRQSRRNSHHSPCDCICLQKASNCCCSNSVITLFRA